MRAWTIKVAIIAVALCSTLGAAPPAGLPVTQAPGAPGSEEDPFASAAPPAQSPFRTSLVAAPGPVDPGDEVALRVRLHIPDEHWVYQERTFLEVLPGKHFVVAGVDAPPAVIKHDPFLDEEVPVYKHDTEFVARLVPAASGDATAVLHYQGCNNALCFFPTADTLHVALEVRAALSAAQTAETQTGFQERLNDVLARNFSNPFLALAVVALLGLLSAATPCVYPMIPITARILVGRGGTSAARGRLHAFTYCAGIVVIYAVLGLVAALTGGGFNEVMRQPLLILFLALLFALLGLSMVGLFEIQLPAAIATRVDSSTSRYGGFFGTGLMGIGAGLVVSPCVGPVVVFILTQIAAQIASLKAAGAGSAATATPLFYGSFLMAGYGAGLSIPFLVAGLTAHRLARPGNWMIAVRVALGFVILYFAYDYFLKALLTAGVERSLSHWMLAGIVMVFAAVFAGAFRTHIEPGPHAGWQKVRLSGSILLLVVGVFFLWTSLSRSGLVGGVQVSSSPVPPASTPFESSHGLEWHRDFAAASAAARAEGVPLFLDFYADWCSNCKVFGKQAAAQGPLRQALESVVRVKIYDTDPIYQEFKNDPRYPELKVGLPFFAILCADGQLQWKGNDYRAHETFIRELERARSCGS